mmetsp:Transcript_8766/g.14874  ORF Transcript_8766/g.14874 Transcript_8766/m.14874 type:complete len:148 (+) Transcript_8766:353-796(+)
MRAEKYIELGKTKMVDIDFSLSFPATSYFLSVNLLVEFTSQGQVVPTRIDCLPYKLSAFATHNKDPTGTIDLLKFCLVIYTAFVVAQNYLQLKTLRNMLKFQNLIDNATDITIVFLQTYTFMIKLSDADSFNIDPLKILDKPNRQLY